MVSKLPVIAAVAPLPAAARTLFSDVHPKLASVQQGSVQAFDRFLCLFLVAHRNEGKAA